MTLKAFNNSEEFKSELVALAIQHREQDQYIKGEYGRMNGKFNGCSVGCLIYDINQKNGTHADYGDHSFLAEQLGVPEFICRLQDNIFENLPEPLNTEWTERLINAIPVGVDLSPVLPRFLIRTLDGLPKTDRKDVVDAIKSVRDVLQNWADTGAVDVSAKSAVMSAESAAESAESAARSAARLAKSAVMSAESAAWSAAESAARSAARSAKSAESAARSAAWSAVMSAESAVMSAESAVMSAESAVMSAESAAWSAAWSAVMSAAWEQIANDLIACIQQAS